MFTESVRIAIGKATDNVQRSQLEQFLPLATAVDESEERFPAAIAENRARHGIAPEKLSKSTKATLAGLATDQVAIQARLFRDLAALEDATEVIGSLQLALDGDVTQSTSMLKHFPAHDRPVAQSHLQTKTALLQAFNKFLEQFSG